MVRDFEFLQSTCSGVYSQDELRTLYQQAKLCQQGVIVELGANCGQGSIALAWGNRDGESRSLYAVDPYDFDLVKTSGADAKLKFIKNTLETQVAGAMRMVQLAYESALEGWQQPIGLLVVSKAVANEKIASLLSLWLPQCLPGATLLLSGDAAVVSWLNKHRQQYHLGQITKKGKLCIIQVGKAKRENAVMKSQLNAAVKAHQGGDFAKAEQGYRAVLAVEPENTQALNNFGLVLKAKRQFDEAESVCLQSVQLMPDSYSYRYNFANVLRAAQKHNQAIAHYAQVVAVNPEFINAWLNWTECLRDLGRLQQGKDVAERCLALYPDEPRILLSYAGLLYDDHETDAATALYDKILTLQPDNVQALENKAVLMKQKGDAKAALPLYDRVIELVPERVSAFLSSVELRQFERGDEWFDKLAALDSSAKMTLMQRYQLNFALAKMYQSVKDYDTSFKHYDMANSICRQVSVQENKVFNCQNHSAYIDRIIATFSQSFFEQIKWQGSESSVPVFVVGMPRSGTTLTETLIATHSDGEGVGELDDISQLAGQIVKPDGKRAGFPESIQFLTQQQANALAGRYLKKLQRLVGDVLPSRVVDKMPGNYMFLGFIALLFPNAKVVYCQRDPIDNCLSCFMQNFTSKHEYSNDLADLAHVYLEHERLMQHWLNVLPLPVHTVRYEDVVGNPEPTIKALIEFCGLSWQPEILNFHQTKRSVKTASVVQVRQPLYTSSKGKWRQFEKHLGVLINGLGLGNNVVAEDEA